MSSSLSLTVRLQHAIAQPSLPIRCLEVTRLLQEASCKDAHEILRIVIESVFGFGEEIMPNEAGLPVGGGWGLRVITFAEHRTEFQALRVFLAPDGPLLSLAFRMVQDQCLPFPVSKLPMKAQADIKDGTASNFFTSKLQSAVPGKTGLYLMLNTFEFYLFHFAHFLISGPGQRWSLSWTSVNDAFFPSLLEDYLVTFLPCDASVPPGPPSPPISPRTVLSPVTARQSAAGVRSPVAASSLSFASFVSPISKPMNSPHLLMYGVSDGGGGVGGVQTSSPVPSLLQAGQQQQTVSSWTSQVFAQVILELWINQSLPREPLFQGGSMCPASASSPHTMSSGSTSHASDICLPSSDQVRVVRMTVKHLHYFTNSLKPAHPHHLDYLRRNLFPSSRKVVYQFLQHLFCHWPLDSSFRLSLETWLSFIQPWRYCSLPTVSKSQSFQGGTEDTAALSSVDEKWIPFISENLLSYSFLFDLILGRLRRLDLAASKNAQMFYRVAKVFGQDKLMSHIKFIEAYCLEKYQMHRPFMDIRMESSGVSPSSYLQPPQTSGDLTAYNIALAARMHMAEMEGANYCYESMCCKGTILKLMHMVSLAKSALVAVQAELVHSVSIKEVKENGWWKWLIVGLLGFSSSTTDDSGSREEIQRTLYHLENGIRLLCTTFELPDIRDQNGFSHERLQSKPSEIESLTEKMSFPEQVMTPDGPVLSPMGRYQLLNGMRRMDLKFDGDPDLRPLCTYEVAFLVRWLYLLSSFINAKYATEIRWLYYRQDIIGHVARVFLCPPRTVYEYSKSGLSSIYHRRVAKGLPPRISFRFAASKQLLGGLLAFYLVLCICGCTFSTIAVKLVFPLFLSWMVYWLVKGCRTPTA